ncbi:MAG: hypothetical protein MPW14_14825 [Candidatus Manganitrophus sp.]|nr:MAG: hypothetical protein MPW14_14825 [Candidatus Manganitrophus sp.]
MRNSVVLPAPFGPMMPTMAPARQLEAQVVDQQPVAVALAQIDRFDHLVAEARAGRDEDFLGLVARLRSRSTPAPRSALRRALLLAWRPLGVCAHPFELLLHRLLAGALLLLLLREALLLLLQPGGVVALAGDAAAAVELQDPLGHVVEEIAVVRHRHHGAGELRCRNCSSHATDSASRWLVGSSSSSMSGLDSSSRHSATRRFSPPESLVTSRLPGRQAQRVGGDFELPVQLPGVHRVDLLLQLPLLLEQRRHLRVGHRLGELRR